jgi:hypothetical protein
VQFGLSDDARRFGHEPNQKIEPSASSESPGRRA